MANKDAELVQCWEWLRAVPEAVQAMDGFAVEQVALDVLCEPSLIHCSLKADDLRCLDADDIRTLGGMLKKVRKNKLLKLFTL